MTKKFLHVGCGQAKKENTTQVLKEDSWDEVRLDIDPSVKPDIVGDILDLNVIDDNSYDAVFSSHNIEHVFMHEVKIALSEFKRVLKDDGFLLLCCPDISKACEMIASGKVGEKLYDSPAGPIFPLELLYVLRCSFRVNYKLLCSIPTWILIYCFKKFALLFVKRYTCYRNF